MRRKSEGRIVNTVLAAKEIFMLFNIYNGLHWLYKYLHSGLRVTEGPTTIHRLKMMSYIDNRDSRTNVDTQSSY